MKLGVNEVSIDPFTKRKFLNAPISSNPVYLMGRPRSRPSEMEEYFGRLMESSIIINIKDSEEGPEKIIRGYVPQLPAFIRGTLKWIKSPEINVEARFPDEANYKIDYSSIVRREVKILWIRQIRSFIRGFEASQHIQRVNNLHWSRT